MGIDAYKLGNAELVNMFMNASAKAAIENGRYLKDVFADHYLADALFLKGVLLSRLDRQEPPWKPGDTLVAKNHVRSFDLNRRQDEPIPAGALLKVRRIRYIAKGEWMISFSGLKDEYKADNFSVPPPPKEDRVLECGCILRGRP